MQDLSKQFEQALLSLDRLTAKRLVSLSTGRLTPMELVDQVIVTSLSSIGKSWERGDAALSQVYMSGRICEEIVDGLLPPGDPDRRDQPPMAIAVLDVIICRASALFIPCCAPAVLISRTMAVSPLRKWSVRFRRIKSVCC